MRLRSFHAAVLTACLGLAGWANAAPEIASSVLPNGRSIGVGNAATAYAVIANTGDQAATSCSISLGGNNQAPVALSYQTADANLQLIGTVDTPVDIPAGQNQFFVIAVTPNVAYSGPVALRYACNNATALGQPGVNDLQLVAETGGTVADILSVSLTPSSDGVVRIGSVGGTQVMTIAAVYPGAGAATADIRVSPDVTGYDGTVQTLEICETDAAGTCFAARSTQVDTTFTQGTVKYFAIFVTSPQQGGIPLYPALTRVRAVFSDQPPASDSPNIVAPLANESVRSITSSALTAPAPANADTSGVGYYRFRIRDIINDPTGSFMDNGELVVLPDGTAVGAITVIESAQPYRQVFTLSNGAFNPNGTNGPVFGGTLNLLETPDGNSALSAPFTMRYTPGTGMLAQFSGNAAANASGIDGSLYIKRSDLAFTGLMLSRILIPLAVLNISQVTGTYDVVDPTTLATYGQLAITAQLFSATLALSQGGSSCSMQSPFALQQALAVMVLTELVITGCAMAGTFSGVGVFDTITDPGFIVLRLYIYSQIAGFYLLARLAQSENGDYYPVNITRSSSYD